MNLQTKRSGRSLRRALLLTSAVALIAISFSSCTGVGGMFGRGKNDTEAATVAGEETKKKKKPFSLFNRSKDKNAWISDDETTTRRDRMAKNNEGDFSSATTPQPTPAPAARTARTSNPISEPLSPTSDLELDPAIDSRPTPRMTAGNSRPEADLMLPTLDSDFPKAGGSNPPTAPYPTPAPTPRRTSYDEDDGYTPLQPKLPGAESIQPPSE